MKICSTGGGCTKMAKAKRLSWWQPPSGEFNADCTAEIEFVLGGGLVREHDVNCIGRAPLCESHIVR